MHRYTHAHRRPADARAPVRSRPAQAGTIVAAAVVLLALTACGTAGGGDAEPDRPAASSTTPSSAATGGPAPAAFAAEWQPRLEGLPEGVGPCQAPTETACAQAIGDIMAVTVEMETALDTSALTGAFPKTLEQIGKMRDGYGLYEELECEVDPAADSDACYGAALDVTAGPAMLDMTLTTDKYQAKTG